MIYILEDDESIRKLVVYGLESQGFTVEGFALPSAFHRAMERALPELVLLDLMLPEEDGLHILRDLRASAATRTLPVILLTARDTEYDRVIGLDGGADDVLRKHDRVFLDMDCCRSCGINRNASGQGTETTPAACNDSPAPTDK